MCGTRNYRLQSIQLPRRRPARGRSTLFEIVWDDLHLRAFRLRPSGLWRTSRRYGGQATHRLSSGARTASGGGEPQAASLPVVIGSGFHPFPFRTRKLSLIPPMVLHGKLCGRVGRCRHCFQTRERKPRGFCFVQQRPATHSFPCAAWAMFLRRRARAAAGCGRVGRCRH